MQAAAQSGESEDSGASKEEAVGGGQHRKRPRPPATIGGTSRGPGRPRIARPVQAAAGCQEFFGVSFPSFVEVVRPTNEYIRAYFNGKCGCGASRSSSVRIKGKNKKSALAIKAAAQQLMDEVVSWRALVVVESFF